MSDERLEKLLRESRSAIEPNQKHRRVLEAQLTRRDDSAPPLTAILLAPIAMAVLVAFALMGSTPAQQESEWPMNGSDWEAPVTASETMPWTIVKARENRDVAMPVQFTTAESFDF